MLYSVHLKKTHGGMVETSSMNNIIIKFGNYQLSLQLLLPPLRGGYCKTQGLGIDEEVPHRPACGYLFHMHYLCIQHL